MDTTSMETTPAHSPPPCHVGEYIRPANILPVEAELAERDLARVLKKHPATPDQVADLRTRLCRSARGANAMTLLEFDYPGVPEYAGTQQIVTQRRGVLAIAAAVPMLLDPATNPEAELARRRTALKVAAIEADREGAQRRVVDQAVFEKQMQARSRLNRWNMRPRLERGFLRLAHARPQDADLIRAIALVLTGAPEIDDELPPGDIDLHPPVRR